MNIKYLLSSLVILFSVSFSAFAYDDYNQNKLYRVISFRSDFGQVIGNCGLMVGDITRVTACLSATWNCGKDQPCNASQAFVVDKKILAVRDGSQGRYTYVANVELFKGCASGEIWNPETNQCEAPKFCSLDSTKQQMRDYESSCLADGGSPTIICNDQVDPPDFRMSCDVPPPKPDPDECTPDSPDWPACQEPPEPEQCTPDSPDYPNCCDESNNWCDNPPPESCTIFSPNWPACSGDTDIDPPTGGDLGDPDKPNGGGTGNPDPDKPEPDVEENSDTTKAIESMNKDLNKQLTGINNDLNKNHAENISHLDALKDSIDLNTDTIVDSSNHLKNAIESQTGTLSDIGNTNNKLLSSLNHLLNDGIGELSGDLKGIEGAINSGLDDLESGINGTINAGNCQSFSCEGNAATCYLAKQAWYESCQSKDLSEITEAGAGLLEGIGDYNDQFTDEHGAYKNIYENAEGSVGDLLQAYDESNGVNFDGECPAPKHYDGGLFKFTIDLAPFCEMAYIIRACIMAAAAFGSFMMISKFI
ncbi:chemotaxis protein [Vibrio parahaemolyticus]|uniref:virulence factor TspB C-terminal domain-related protein n=1 Tax=Vibrio parahaemolyticus TaxID=670 RepID=UPI00137554CC|nr:chemotaxis protein [Vibrio parahaemolyticus]MCF9023644.1 chemotaxis protein [Vibrio parahaemolyticus]MCF9045126.1 chemotaxis protein [Vibrio parahaemolyticus]NCN19033.1 chemotaxis protein [Vibrio parahaemolyticus]